MNIFEVILLATVAIAAVAALRTQLIFEIQGTSLLLFHDRRPGLVLYTILMLPGTIIHELSHWLVAEVLQVRTGKITILPEWGDEEGKAGEQRLGSVETVSTDPIRGFLIGLAPFVTGIAILMIFATLMTRWWGVAPWWWVALVIYGSMVIGNSMLISSADRRNWPVMIVLLVAAYLIATRIGLQFSPAAESNIIAILLNMTKALALAILVNLATIGGCFGIRKSVEHITKRKIVRR